MFTGIVSEIGKVKKIGRSGSSYRLEVISERVGLDLILGDSVAVNGVCLSIIKKKQKSLVFDVVNNTFKSTNLKRLKLSSSVNLESALKMGDNISGHIVSGHVDTESKIKQNKKTSKGWLLDISLQSKDNNYLIPKGSIAIDGISLTIGEILSGYFRIYLIPHTLGNTTLTSKKSGEYVNIEFDINAKYAQNEKMNKGNITKDILSQNGFI